MAATQEFLDLVLEKLARLGVVSGRRMFGGFGVFHEDAMFGLISNDILYLKADDSNRDVYVKYGSPQYKPMPYFQVPDDVFEDAKELLRWAKQSIDIAHAAPPKKKR
ncbi:TfoX/Sxy family protein [Dehalogenimonas sp. THU2]|uniref:TfoX/Sxy family protein n=1 Tax=Dehalogenimonas sp. THU2 TaxID=3151121 RepID=UPI003218B192